MQEIYSYEKHTNGKRLLINPNKLKIICPMKFSIPENGIECDQEKCAWWMIIQKACAINVNARIMYKP
jgi:hypothetical protein